MTHTVDTLLGTFNFNQAQKFRRLYNDAAIHDQDTFSWREQPVDIDFARYMVEFLVNNFPLETTE